MVFSYWKPILIIAVLSCCSFSTLAVAEEGIPHSTVEAAVSQSSEASIHIGQAETGESFDSEENEDAADVFPQQLQENYRSGLVEIIGFYDAKSTAIQTRLDVLELLLKSIKGSVDLLSQKFETPVIYLNSLSTPKKGSSFHGKSIEQIAAEVSNNHVTVVEIVNHLDVELTDYQLDLQDGWEHQEAPKTVAFKTREVFTFKKGNYSFPRGVFLYRVGDTGFSLHLLFYWYGFAVGFLENNAPIETFEPIWGGFNNYTHTGPPDSVKCIEDFHPWKNNTRTVTIHVGAIYAKLTVQSKSSDSNYRMFYTIEVFKFDP